MEIIFPCLSVEAEEAHEKLRIVSVPLDFRNEHFQDKSLEPCRYAILFGVLLSTWLGKFRAEIVEKIEHVIPYTIYPLVA